MSSHYYLPLRHVIAKTVHNEILQKENQNKKRLINSETEFITTGFGYDKETILLIEFSCPADINIVNEVSEKENICDLLQKKGPSNFAFSIALRSSQLSLTAISET